MEKITFIVATGANMDIDGIRIEEGKQYPIQHDFRNDIPPITSGILFKENGLIKCSAMIPYQYLGAFPYIGVANCQIEPTKGKDWISEGDIFAISLGFQPNQDGSIKVIAEQIKSKPHA